VGNEFHLESAVDFYYFFVLIAETQGGVSARTTPGAGELAN
jgi:hypothetical protein